jgi:hypothetical protein
MKLKRGIEVQIYSFFNLSARWGWVVEAIPQDTLSLRRTKHALYRRVGGWVLMISTPPQFKPQTIQPIVNHYTNYTYTVLAQKQW